VNPVLLDAALRGAAAPFASMAELLNTGGWVLPWIALVGLVMWTIIIERLWYVVRVHPRRVAAIRDAWQQRSDRGSWCARRIRRAWLADVQLGLEAPLPLLRATIPLCPLLGLLGTVTGMLEVFDAMRLAGAADAEQVAYGVSHAMTATLAGLATSLSGMFFVSQLRARVRREALRLPSLLPL
jgi:biopolymer transport protein ExbB